MAQEHHHHASGSNLKLAFFLNVAFTIFEIIGGLYVNSVAIISDAIHDLGDSLSLGTSWYLQKKAKKESDARFSFGYKRFSLLGALINGIVLLAGSVFVIIEAVERISKPEPSNAPGMVVFAIVGILVNGFAAYRLSGGKSMNEKVVSLHLLEDVMGWAAVLIVAIILLFTDLYILDPILSLAITVFILWGVIKRLKDTLFIFLQGVPADVNLDEIREKLLQIENIGSLHHMHVWSLEGDSHVFTTHIKLKDISSFQQLLAVKQEAKKVLQDYNFDHYTIETELDEETCALR